MVYCEDLGDGWFRVTLKIAELDRTNNNANADNALLEQNDNEE